MYEAICWPDSAHMHHEVVGKANSTERYQRCVYIKQISAHREEIKLTKMLANYPRLLNIFHGRLYLRNSLHLMLFGVLSLNFNINFL